MIFLVGKKFLNFLGNVLSKTILSKLSRFLFHLGIPINAGLLMWGSSGFYCYNSNFIYYYKLGKNSNLFGQILSYEETNIGRRPKYIRKICFKNLPNGAKKEFIMQAGYQDYNIEDLNEDLRNKIVKEKI